MIARIRKLSNQLVNQIAAGEVVERPASVVKELVENSIDAGATRVVVTLEDGGARLIEVTDNGIGIAPDDLELAVTSHATSKLETEADLHRIVSLGFRGEALASIASVSEFELASRPPGQDSAERVKSAGDTLERVSPVRLEPGTRVTVRNLFSRVPARKRFLKSSRAEVMRTRGIIERIALAHPLVDLTLVSDDKEVRRFPARDDEMQRVTDVLGKDTAGRLLELKTPGGRRIRGFIGRPDLHKRNSDGIRIFVGGRCVEDKTVLHAIRDAYREFQIPGHYPVAVIFLDIEPDEVDVNVHPQKSEVRFRDSGQIHRLVRHSIRDRLQEARSVPRFDIERGASDRAGVPGSATPGVGDLVPKRDNPLWRTPEGTGPGGGSAGDGSAGGADAVRETSTAPLTLGDLAGDGQPSVSRPSEAVAGRTSLVDEHNIRVFQMRNAYLVVESDEGMTIIDQHALHEKVLYEEICAAREKSTLKQPLAVPETLNVDTREQEILAEASDAIASMGFDVEEFGEDTVAIRSVPAGLSRRGAGTILREVLHRLGDAMDHGGEKRVDFDHEIISTIACKRAVKAGQPLAASEQQELIRARHRAFQPQNCPHGRPSEIFLRWDELDRRFDRK